MTTLAALAVCILTASQPAAAPPAPHGAFTWQHEDLSALSLDDLINRLPSVDAEGVYDDRAHEWVPMPEVVEMRSRLADGVTLSQSQWQRALTRTGILLCRPKWPVGGPVIVSMETSAWLPRIDITLTPRNAGLNHLACRSPMDFGCGNAMALDRRMAAHQNLGMLPLGKHRITFDADIERTDSGLGRRSAQPGTVWKGEIALDLEIVATLDEAVTPIDGGRMAAAISNAVGVAKAPWKDVFGDQLLIVFDANLQDDPRLASTVVSASAQIFRDGELKSEFPIHVARSDELLSANSVYPGPVQLFTFATIEEFPSTLIDDPDELARWSIRLTGTNSGVVDCKYATHYWNGVLEVGFDQALSNESNRTAGRPPRCYVWMP